MRDFYRGRPMSAGVRRRFFEAQGRYISEQENIRRDPDYWRTVNLVTVRNRPQSRAVGALVHEAMKTAWADKEALAVAMHSIKG